MLATVYKQNNLLWNNLNEVTTTNQLQASLSCMDATMHGHILYFTENTNTKNFTTTYRVNGKITLMRYLNNRKSDIFFSLNYFLIEFFPPPALFMVLFHWFITHCGIFLSISLSSHPSQSANFTPLNKNASRIEGKTKKIRAPGIYSIRKYKTVHLLPAVFFLLSKRSDSFMFCMGH